jgi:hypothetical protein
MAETVRLAAAFAEIGEGGIEEAIHAATAFAYEAVRKLDLGLTLIPGAAVCINIGDEDEDAASIRFTWKIDQATDG